MRIVYVRANSDNSNNDTNDIYMHTHTQAYLCITVVKSMDWTYKWCLNLPNTNDIYIPTHHVYTYIMAVNNYIHNHHVT